MVGRQRTIFEGLSRFNFHEDNNKAIRFNAFFKMLGFERVNLSQHFNTNSFYPQLTLMICPNLSLPRDVDYPKEEDFKESLSVFTTGKMDNSNNDYNNFVELLAKKIGYVGLRNYSVIIRSKEDIKPIIIEDNGKQHLLGHYLKERNIVFLYVNPFNTDYSQEEHLEYLLKIFEEKIKGMEIKKADVSEKLKMICIEKYKEQISDKIIFLNNEVQERENNITDWRTSILNAMRNILLQKKQVEALSNFSSSTDEALKTSISKIKELEFVKDVKLTSLGVSVDVGSINISYKGKDVYIGDFVILISPEKIKVFCKNPVLNNNGVEMYHPHINVDNSCFGTTKLNLIDECFANFQLDRVVFLVNMFLHTYTAGDSYSSITLWTREDIKRKPLHEVKDEEDLKLVDFKGDYFYRGEERFDTGDDEDSDEDDIDEDNDVFVGDCANCSDSIYESNDTYTRDDDDNLFCCRDCQRRFRDRDLEN